MKTNKQIRKNFITLIERYSIDELNTIPKQFNNNIIWNFGHIIATQQLLTYGLANIPTIMPEKLITSFRKGSQPPECLSETELYELKELSYSTLVQFEEDLEENKFKNFESYPTSFGVTLNNIEQAILFNVVHESLHLGYVMALVKAL